MLLAEGSAASKQHLATSGPAVALMITYMHSHKASSTSHSAITGHWNPQQCCLPCAWDYACLLQRHHSPMTTHMQTTASSAHSPGHSQHFNQQYADCWASSASACLISRHRISKQCCMPASITDKSNAHLDIYSGTHSREQASYSPSYHSSTGIDNGCTWWMNQHDGSCCTMVVVPNELGRCPRK